MTSRDDAPGERAGERPGAGSDEETFDDGRLDELVDLIVQLASGNLKARLEPSPARDSVDAVITGINLLAEELDLVQRTMEDRVAERTAELDQARRDMERLALNDALTGLANRTLLGDRISQATARAERGERPPCVLLLDLDEFKTINDGLGHGAGDRILVEVAPPDPRRGQRCRHGRAARRGRVRGADAGCHGGRGAADRAPRTGGAAAALHGRRSHGVDGGQHRRLLRARVRPRICCCGTRTRRCTRRRPSARRTSRSSAPRCTMPRGRACRSPPSSARPSTRRAAARYQPIVELALGRRRRGARPLGAPHPGPAARDFIPVAEDSGHIIELGHWVIQDARSTQLAGRPAASTVSSCT